MRRLVLAATATFLATPVLSATVDLSGWQSEEANGSPAANWTVQGSDNDSVFQSVNSRPSLFFNPGANSQGLQLSGQITVETSSDDDFIGFVLGYNTGELGTTTADFWLIDWKQINQPFYGNVGSAGAAGLAVSHVNGDTSTAPESDFWNHTNSLTEVQRATNLGNTGWVDNQTYSFDLIFTADLIQVKVDGVTELNYTSAAHGSQFTNGSFGFYNYSQSNVRYAGITEDVAPPPNVIPLPAGFPLLLAGLGALGVMRRRQK